MTVQENNVDQIPFRGYEVLKDSLLYGFIGEDLPAKKEELIRTSLYLKAAGFRSADQLEIITIPNQWVWPEAHHFLESIIESGEKNLIYEWCQILKSKSGCLPANILYKALEWASKDLEFAHYLIPVIGAAGNAIANLIPEWNLFSAMLSKNPLKFEKPEMRIFAFKQFRIQDSENAFNYFLESHHHLKEAEKLKWIRVLKNKISLNETAQLNKIFDSGKMALQFELVILNLQNTELDYFQNCKSEMLNCLHYKSLNDFQFACLGKKAYNWPNAQKIKCIPPAFIESEKLAISYIEWIESQNEQLSLLEATRFHPSMPFVNWYFQHLLKNNKLTEDFPTALLSSGFDHIHFNQACIQWIDTTGDQLDLEAFLHFINLEKHFWTDELLAKILELRNNKVLDRKYDFTIFWQLLPFKVNPNSIHIKSIPAECRFFTNTLINFETTIEFRKLIRK